jgi:cysteine-rich repeat protein
MRPLERFKGGACAAAAVALAASALGWVATAHGDIKDSIACRGGIAKGFSGVGDTGFKAADACHKASDKAMTGSGACNDVNNSAFDPKGKYAKSKAKAHDLIVKKCLPGEAVLANFENNDPESTLGSFIDSGVGGNSLLVEGFQNFAGDKAKKKCAETVGKSRTAIVKEVLKGAIKCQTAKDKTATTVGQLGAIDASCSALGAPKSIAKAQAKIPGDCGSLDGAADLGICSPLPQCVIDAATQVGEDIAAALYQKLPPPIVCGNGIVQGDEQCDDGGLNGTPGDLCNSNCELLTETCGPGTPAAQPAIIGHRIITFNLGVPVGTPLAGVQVGFDYPQLEASIKGTGFSSVVQSQFQVLVPQPPDGFLSLGYDSDVDATFLISSSDDFIVSGPLVQVTLDECTPLSQHLCNRNQNIIGCCPTTDLDACNASPDDPVACFCGANGIISQTDCTVAGCTNGVCVGIPAAPAGSCDPGTKKCIAGSPNPGKACTVATETADCSGVPVDQATCTADHACSRLGDQTNGFYGCASIFNPPGAANGQFPPVAVGPTTVPPAPPGSCPTNNTCVSQIALTQLSCHVSNPVNHLALPVDGVTCSIDITEAP